ncbi:Nucleosomal histone H3-Lys79 methylase [Coemansia sp. S100]|nr:Nucleosomal histone H3-Lys79 methylase [Coemansia sp. S680]KAJ2029867.1 Nucleosomal histone H3-Lys79 methylase [Coemansia sp. S3946]KAJ2081612.1 Nucleosomal histone H3-Lys79 methylase [Coemansia sp. S100]KAJ2425777.1 Nucleosomal histone H3-Lys79 methylase [Coemansia sp. RSA 2531]
MDFFFGTPKNSSKGQQTVTIRIEERVVGKPNGKPTSSSAAAADTRSREPGISSLSTTTLDQPSNRQRPSVSGERPSQVSRSGERSSRQRQSETAGPGSDKEALRPTARYAVKRTATEALSTSARDSTIVNANRERVGSLPGTPRPRKQAGRLARSRSPTKRSPQPRQRHQKVAPASPELCIERCSSVPVSTGAKARRGGDAASAIPLPSGDQVDDENDTDMAAAAIVDSGDAIKQSETPYESYFTWEGDNSSPSTIELHLPAAGASETFSLLMPKSYDRDAEPRDEYLPVNDLMSTIHAIATYLVDSAEFKHQVCGDKENGIMRRLERSRNRRNGNDFVRAVGEFNALLDAEREAGRTGPCFDVNLIPSELAIHVIEQIYNRVVAPTVGSLRQYKAFSNNVYGEILPTLVNEFIDRTNITHKSTFVDLGCGIGNVVLQVAAQTGCDASGIEIMKVPARFAKRQAREFEHRMRLYKLRHGSVQVWRGDFCESPSVQALLPKADVLLVNNYAFDSTLNQNLLQLFLDLKEGTKIISLKPFVTPDHKISARNIYSPESILKIRRYPYWSQCVSWTDSGGEYFIQTVDRSRVKEFLTSRGMV